MLHDAYVTILWDPMNTARGVDPATLNACNTSSADATVFPRLAVATQDAWDVSRVICWTNEHVVTTTDPCQVTAQCQQQLLCN